MSKWRRLAWGLPLALLLAGLALVAWLPARWVVPRWQARMHDRVQFDDIGGSVWRGHAGDVSLLVGQRRVDLGRLDWQLSPSVLLHRTDIRFALDGPSGSFAGHMRTLDAQTVAWDGLALRGGLAALDGFGIAPDGAALRGTLDLRDGHIQLRDGWPQSGEIALDWRDAGLLDHGRLLALGNLHAQAQATGGVMQAQAQDDGSGALRVDGRAVLSPLGWRYQLTLAPRRHDEALSRWLAQFGPLDGDGALHLHGSGGIAAIGAGDAAKGAQP